MIEHRTLGHWLRRFLAEYIVTERRLARNTQKSYRDSFTLLLPFLGKTARKPVDRLAVADLTAKRALAFLDHLEQERGCSAQTRNQRLAAIRSFARFVASRDPAQVDWSAQIRSLAAKKTTAKPVSWMTKDEVEALLAVPDRRTSRGRTEHALVLFLYNTGARVSEVTGLRAGDVRSGDDGRYPLANLNGKGGKVRQCPLWRRTVEALAELMKGRPDDAAVFLSSHRRPYTRFGVYRLVERCAAGVPELAGRAITPHLVRHTTACHLLQAGVDLNTIRAWLGHVSLETTNVYAEIDLEAKAEAIAQCDASPPDRGRPWKEDKGVIAFLNAL